MNVNFLFDSKKVEKGVIICPHCASTEVQTDWSSLPRTAGGFSLQYLCNQCGHLGTHFPEVTKSEVKTIQKQAEEHKWIEREDKTQKVDMQPGIFEMKVMWKIFAPVCIMIGIMTVLKYPARIFPGMMLILFGAGLFYFAYIHEIKK